MSTLMNKSYLRWSGSKSRILDRVLDSIGDCTDKVFMEPFFGSGVISLNVNAESITLSDSNNKLVRTHNACIMDPERVISACKIFWSFGVDSYYKIREDFNNKYDGFDIYTQAGMFIYLNKHCFNGLYRENKSGKFNTPVDKDAKISIPEDNIREFAKLNSVVLCKDFEYMFMNEFYDVVYVDPPYPSDSISNSEIKYTKDGFTKEDHIRLHECCSKAAKAGARVVVSYCDIKFIRELYSDADEIIELTASRSISSKAGTRGKAKEIIIIYYGSS
jgi:DNA adenine methylase